MIPYVSHGSVEGNAEVIGFLERWLERAKLGQLNFIAAAVCEGPLHVYHDMAGKDGMEFAANWGLEVLKQRLVRTTENREPPPVDKSAPADRWIWLATKGPACWDFFAWLVMVEMARMREHAEGPLKIGFYWGADGNRERVLQTAGRRQMYSNVILPGIALVGAVEDQTCLERGRVLERYTFYDVVQHCKLGEDVPLMVPSAAAVEAVEPISSKGPYVTITLREAAYSAHRNSNLDDWRKFADYLTAQGERVIFVRDTCNALETIDGYRTCPAASVDVDVRCALYEGARCNFFVSNGPWTLALFGTRPWLMFNQVNAMDPYTPNTDQWWRQYHGIGAGEQFPWSRPSQRILWERDEFSSMTKAWEELEPLLSLPMAAE